MGEDAFFSLNAFLKAYDLFYHSYYNFEEYDKDSESGDSESGDSLLKV